MFKTHPITGQWLRDCQGHGWTAAHKLARCPQFEPLKQKLLALGGTAACIWNEPDYQALMARGQAWDGRNSTYSGGEASLCHVQTAKLWGRDGVKLCTGWALSSDGMWRQHSWGLSDEKIVETTPNERVGYFGFVMTDREATAFASTNAR